MFTIWTKIKLAFVAILTGTIAILSALYSREKSKRKEAEEERNTQITINDNYKKVATVQSDISETVLNAHKPIKKQKTKASKILLPVFICLLFIGCAKIKYVSHTSAPELFVFETGIELELVDDNYCMSEISALKLQQVLSSYKEQIEKYNQWRLSYNGIKENETR